MKIDKISEIHVSPMRSGYVIRINIDGTEEALDFIDRIPIAVDPWFAAQRLIREILNILEGATYELPSSRF